MTSGMERSEVKVSFPALILSSYTKNLVKTSNNSIIPQLQQKWGV
ncbi:MAG: hypothetical protein ACRCUY_10315 [Thermoguttaceae bacterium]